MLPVRRSRIIQPSLGQTIAYGNPRTAGLIGAWEMVDGGGPTVTDLTNRYGSGTINGGGVWTVAQQGTEVALTAASSQYIQVASNSANYPLAPVGTSGTASFTVEILVWLNSLRNYQGLFSKTDSNEPWPIDTYIDNAGTLHFFWGNGGSSSSLTVGGMTASKWLHIVITANAAEVGNIYLNGILIATTSSVATCSDGSGAIRLGNRNDNATYLDGKIARARLWNRPLLPAEVMDEYVNPFSIFDARTPRVFGYQGGSNVQTLIPTGLPSAFAAGTPDLKYNQDLGMTGLASGFAPGEPNLEFLNTVIPTGLPSGFAVGVPTLSLGTITPTGKASDFAPGRPTLNLYQAVVPTGLPTAFAAGKPSLVPAQVIDTTGLASGFVPGQPVVTGGPQRIALSQLGLPSGFKAGVPTLTGGEPGIMLLIGGVDYTRYLSVQGIANSGTDSTTVAQPMQITSQTLGRWTAIFDFIDLAGAAYPEIQQTFVLIENGVKIMSGGIVSVQVDRIQSAIGSLQSYHVTAQDWSAICDRRVVNATYPAGSDIAGIVLSIWANVLCVPNEGITANNVPEIGGPLGLTDTTEVFNFVSVTQAFNQLATDTGCVWWIDQNADLHFIDYTELPVCPFSLTETSDNWRALSATATTAADYRNVQYVTSNLTAVPGVAEQQSGPNPIAPGQPGFGGPVITETYTLPQAAAVARNLLFGVIITNFPIAQITALTVNGVAQPVINGTGLTEYNLQQSWWYDPGFPFLTPPYVGNDTPVFPYPPVTSPYPMSGDVVVISYIAISSSQQAVVAMGNGPLVPATPGLAGTWGSGIFENVQQVQNINLQGDLAAIAQALLNRSDYVPIQIQFETDEPGAMVGQSIYINLPFSFLPGATQWTITYIQATLQTGVMLYGSQFRWVIQATSGQDLGNSTYWFERLIQRTENPLPIQQTGQLTFVLAPGGSLTAGVPANNPVPLTTAGALTQAYVICGTPPTEQNLVVDILDNGVSILSSPLIVPAGSAAQVLTMSFAVAGLTVAIGDLLSVSISYQVIGLAPTPAANVTVYVQWTVAGLPAGQIQPGVYQTYVGTPPA